MKEAEISEILAEATKDRNHSAAGFLAKHLPLEKSRAVLNHVNYEALKGSVGREYAILEDNGDAFTFLMFTGILHSAAVVVQVFKDNSGVKMQGYAKGIPGGESAADTALHELLEKYGGSL